MPDGARDMPVTFAWRPDPEYRYLVCALNGAGKSVLLASLARAFSTADNLVCVLDPKADRSMRVLQPMASRTVRMRGGGIQRFVVPPFDLDQSGMTDEICDAAFRRGNVTLVVDELQMVATDRRYPPALYRCYAQGRARKVSILAASTEPVRIPVWARGQCRAYFAGAIGEGRQRDYMADLLCQERQAFAAAMRALPRYHFLYWEQSWASARRPPEEIWVRPPRAGGRGKKRA